MPLRPRMPWSRPASRRWCGRRWPTFREALVLREIEALSYREIAGLTGVPIGTVMSRLARARAELRKVLARMMRRGESDAV
jgi:RNA polymerase sigma-70 factor, ECF subfamily